ncbi:MAG: cytochrome c [Geminicoccaceae bacterium]
MVAYRKAVMKSLGAHMGALKSILTDQTQLIDQVGLHAHAIGETAKLMPSMFPEGSMDPPTEALPVIWENPEGFQAAIDKLAETATALAETARGGDAQATLAAFGAMGKQGCGGCHGEFRKKKE